MHFHSLSQPLHRHDEARLIIFMSGEYTERAIEGTASFVSGNFIIRPAMFAHDGRGSAGTVYRTLPVSRAAWRCFHSNYGWSARIGKLPPDLVSDPEQLTLCGDMILHDCQTRSYEPLGNRTAMERIARKLRKSEAVRISELSALEGLEPWQLTRRFLDRFGLTPTRFRQEARVQKALKLMAETGLSIASIAAEAGFSDQSHLCRITRISTGQTPATIRQCLMAA